MAETFTPTPPINHEGKDLWFFDSGNDNELFDIPIAPERIQGFRDLNLVTTIPPIPRTYPKYKYDPKKPITERIRFNPVEPHNEKQGEWSRRFYILRGATIFINGEAEPAEFEGWLDEYQETRPDDNISVLGGDFRQTQISMANFLENSAILLRRLTPAIQKEPASNMQKLKDDEPHYEAIEEHEHNAPDYRKKIATDQDQFRTPKADKIEPHVAGKAETTEQRKLRERAVPRFVDSLAYHGSGLVHQAIYEIEVEAQMIAEPNLDDERALGFIINRLDTALNHGLPDPQPSRRGNQTRRGRVYTDFALIYQACMATLNKKSLTIPTNDGGSVKYQQAIKQDDITRMVRDAVVEYNRLRPEAEAAYKARQQASGDSDDTPTINCGLKDNFPDLNYDKKYKLPDLY